jgi:hypothetical protein
MRYTRLTRVGAASALPRRGASRGCPSSSFWTLYEWARALPILKGVKPSGYMELVAPEGPDAKRSLCPAAWRSDRRAGTDTIVDSTEAVAWVAEDRSDQLDNGAVIGENENSAHARHGGPYYREPLGANQALGDMVERIARILPENREGGRMFSTSIAQISIRANDPLISFKSVPPTPGRGEWRCIPQEEPSASAESGTRFCCGYSGNHETFQIATRTVVAVIYSSGETNKTLLVLTATLRLNA